MVLTHHPQPKFRRFTHIEGPKPGLFTSLGGKKNSRSRVVGDLLIGTFLQFFTSLISLVRGGLCLEPLVFSLDQEGIIFAMIGTTLTELQKIVVRK